MKQNRDPEYDAFGPWISKFRDAELLPKRFVGHVDMSIDYDFLAKVPTNKDRRDLKPGMDMYDAVIGLHGDTLYVYERHDTEVEQCVLDVSEVYSMVVQYDLLEGHLYLQLKEREFDIRFNTVSRDVIKELVNLIRIRYMHSSDSKAFSYISSDEIANMDYYYHNEWKSLVADEPDLKILAMQPITRLKYSGQAISKRLIKSLLYSHLKSCLYLTNGKELILSKNGEDFKRLRKSDYSTSYTYIPLNRIISIDTHESELTEELEQHTLKVGFKDFKFLFHKDNATGKHFCESLQAI